MQTRTKAQRDGLPGSGSSTLLQLGLLPTGRVGILCSEASRLWVCPAVTSARFILDNMLGSGEGVVKTLAETPCGTLEAHPQ